MTVRRRRIMRQLSLVTGVGAISAAILGSPSAASASSIPELPSNCTDYGAYIACTVPSFPAPTVAPAAPQAPASPRAGRVSSQPTQGTPAGVTPNTVVTGSNYCTYTNDTRYWTAQSSGGNNSTATAGPLYSTFDARVLAESSAQFTTLNDTEWSSATDAHRWALSSPTPLSGSVTIPWHVGGFMQSHIDSFIVPPVAGSAGPGFTNGYVDVYVALADETTGTLISQTQVEHYTQNPSVAGDYSATETNSGTQTIPVTFTPGDVYEPYVSMYAQTSSTQGFVIAFGVPVFLGANQELDFYDNQGGGFMDSVTYTLNLPVGDTLTCSE